MPYFHENIESCVAAGQGETFHDVVVVAAAASAVAAVVAVVVAAAAAAAAIGEVAVLVLAASA